MREILFRGKRLDNGQWIYGAYGNHTSLDAMIMDKPYLAKDGELSALKWGMVAPRTVGQYTGLTDNHGTKIFEGDILPFHFDDIGDQKAVVVWTEAYAGFQLNPIGDLKFSGIAPCEVIGNIYDNPELVDEAYHEQAED